MEKQLIEESPDGVATLTFNRPDRLNALSTPIMEGLLEALPRLALGCRHRRAHFNPLTIANASGSNLRFIVQNHVQQGTVDFNVAVVINKTQFSKSVHEKAHARSRRSDHLRQCLLADFRYDWLRSTFLAKIRQKQKDPCQSFLARIEQLIDQVLLDTTVASQEVRDK